MTQGICRNCPFRRDVGQGERFFLPADRCTEIHDSLMGDAPFPCHQTMSAPDPRPPCIGAALYLQAVRTDGGLKANLSFRLALKCGNLDELELAKIETPVHQSLQEFIDFCDESVYETLQ